MPVQPAQGTLQNVGDIVGPVFLGQTGVGNPPDTTAVFAFTGVYTNAVVAIEGIPIGQPISQGPPLAPNSSNEWVACLDVALLSGALQSNPITINSTGGPSSGFACAVGSGMYQQLRARLIGNGGGAIQASIATCGFPLSPSPGGAAGGSVNAQNQLELGRIRVGMSILLEGMGINLQDLTSQDIQAFS